MYGNFKNRTKQPERKSALIVLPDTALKIPALCVANLGYKSAVKVGQPVTVAVNQNIHVNFIVILAVPLN